MHAHCSCLQRLDAEKFAAKPSLNRSLIISPCNAFYRGVYSCSVSKGAQPLSSLIVLANERIAEH